MTYVQHVHFYQKVKLDKNFSTSQCNENLEKKLFILKMSRILILHNNNNAERIKELLKKWSIRELNNILSVFQIISFIFQNTSYINFLMFFEIWKNSGNVTEFEYVLVQKFDITPKNFASEWSNSFTNTAWSYFYYYRYLEKSKNILKKLKPTQKNGRIY